MAGILSAPEDDHRAARRERLTLAATLAGLLAIWLLVAGPLLFGQRTLIQRDVFTTHLAMKAYGAAALAHGNIPAFNPAWALGQPFAGNPNALAFYPGNVLYLLLPFWSAFNAHYVLHWLLAFVAFRKLARELEQSALGATLAALTYAGSGYVLSCLTFYNLIAVAAWLPLVLWGLARGGRRGSLLGGIACGLMLLAGEPVTAALALVPMALIAAERQGLRRGLFSGLAVGGIGLLVALPQVVAAARVIGSTFRGAHGLVSAQVASHALQAPRLLELLLPLPWGWPSELGRFGYWSNVTPLTPYIYSLHFGIVALAIGAFAVRRRWRWAVLVGASLLLAYLGGLSGEVVAKLTGGFFRYPQKLLLWTTVGAALLAGWGFDQLLAARPGDRPGAGERASHHPRAVRRLVLGAAASAGVALLLLSMRDSVRELFKERLGARHDWIAATHLTQWFLGFVAAALLLAACAWAVRRQSGVLLLALQALALLQLAPTLATDSVAELAPPAPWIAHLGEARSVALVSSTFPPWGTEVPMRGVESVAEGWRDVRLDLDPATGALHGLTYPLAPDLDGIFSPLQALLYDNLARFGWPARIQWLRLLGADWLVRHDDGLPPPPLELVAAEERRRVRAELYRISDPAPTAFWPQAVLAADSPIQALARVTHLADPLATAVASRAVDHRAGGRVELLATEDDTLRLAVTSAGGLLVVQRAYFPSLEAHLADGRKLPTLPVDLVLLGVEIPAGTHEVRIAPARRLEAFAGVLALLTVALAGWVAWRRPGVGP
ncbi:MAG: hypothetical protein QG573_1455 [Acidobacteriota bacterium]|nr:hypothetical protein [Acidobacteriota bacterium]